MDESTPPLEVFDAGLGVESKAGGRLPIHLKNQKEKDLVLRVAFDKDYKLSEFERAHFSKVIVRKPSWYDHGLKWLMKVSSNKVLVKTWYRTIWLPDITRTISENITT